MMKKIIELIPLAEIGQGKASVDENFVEIEVEGVSGGLKAWLIGGESVPIGNLVQGKLYKRVSTKGHIGILVTQSGRQMFVGKFGKEDKNIIQEEEEKLPFCIEGFNWKKITEKCFSNLSREIRFMLSNRKVYENYKKYGHYWVGDCENAGALALRCDDDTDPFEFLGEIKIRENGYVIVCIDKNTNKLYVPQKR